MDIVDYLMLVFLGFVLIIRFIIMCLEIMEIYNGKKNK